MYRAIVFTKEAQLTNMHTCYFNLVNVFLFRRDYMERYSVEIFSSDEQNLKPKAAILFTSLYEINIVKFKVYMLDHISEDLGRYGDILAVDASSLEHFNFTAKYSIIMTSMRKRTTISEAVTTITHTPVTEEGIVKCVDPADRNGLSTEP